MKLTIEGLEWDAYEVLGLSQVTPAEGAPAGTGTHTDPYVMDSIARWFGAAKKGDFVGKHAFYEVGGRLIHRRVNRAEGKFDHYLTDCGSFTEENKRRLAEALVARVKHDKIDAGASREAFNTPPRWYKAAPDAEFVPLGPSYVDLNERLAVEVAERQDADLAKEVRQVLKHATQTASATVAMITTAWFLAEVNRYHRALLCGLALLDLIEARKNAEKELEGATPYSFRYAVYQDPKVSLNLSHPMSGQGTVKAAKDAAEQAGKFAEYVQDGIEYKKQPAVGALSKVQEKESRILIRWVAWYLKNRNAMARIALAEGGTDRLKVPPKRDTSKALWDNQMRTAFRDRIQSLDLLLT